MKFLLHGPLLGAGASLLLANCATKPHGQPAAVEMPAASADQLPGAPPPTSGIRLGSQEDLAATAGERVYFALDSFALGAEAGTTLDQQTAWLALHPTVHVLIAGNADERGTREYNLALGARRAEAARRRLIAQGVASERIQTVSYGKERPIDFGGDEAAWAKNRNAQTVVMEASGR